MAQGILKKGNKERAGQYNNMRRFCPFIQAPYDDCVCSNMNSQNIEATIYYCSRYFEKCKTYQKWS